ncbi:hypothetical protein RND81_01G201300 [Saponaria officinalis]|uniref:Retrovirus-related Pol polyprotein from transposon TNT 1-94-like beta-barrel domain-containing protein n=1 Tax=Saponaria officinalis TaxID=3572 RepID=A0AAW1NB93_SAPOF
MHEPKKPFTNTVLECRYCKKPGHTIDNCYRLQNRGRRFAGHVQFQDAEANNGTFDQNQQVPVQPNDCRFFNRSDDQKPAAETPFASANFAGNSYSFVSDVAMQNSWILDSGATDHMCANKSLFSRLACIPNPYTISLPNGQIVTIDSVGIVPINSDITLSDVLYVPCFKFNLLSVAKLARQYNDWCSRIPSQK